MTRFRMGKQMLQILNVLDNLKDPEHGYKEASYGIIQTDIILRVLNLNPFTERRMKNRVRYIRPIEDAKKLIIELENQGKIVKSIDAGENLVIDSYDGEYDYEPEQMRVASALMGKRVGQSASPYNFMGRMMAVNLARENPKMRNDPVVKRHYDWVEEYWEGKSKSDKIYASFSRSLKNLLNHNLITSNWYIKNTGAKTRHRHARYLITEIGKEYLRRQ